MIVKSLRAQSRGFIDWLAHSYSMITVYLKLKWTDTCVMNWSTWVADFYWSLVLNTKKRNRDKVTLCFCLWRHSRPFISFVEYSSWHCGSCDIQCGLESSEMVHGVWKWLGDSIGIFWQHAVIVMTVNKDLIESWSVSRVANATVSQHHYVSYRIYGKTRTEISSPSLLSLGP